MNLIEMSLEAQVTQIFVEAPYLENKITQHCELGDSTPAQGLLEVLRFLTLVSEEQVLTPSVRVDLIWHQFILSTRIYSDYCTKLYKKYLHHTPSNDKVENHQQFEHCLNLYAQRYGAAPVWFWGKQLVVNTTGCCSGCEA
jgi:hypothetical protein